MKIRFGIAVSGLACVVAGAFLVYRPLSLILVGAFLLLIAARGGKK